MNKINVNSLFVPERRIIKLLALLMKALILTICFSVTSIYANSSFSQTKIDVDLKDVRIDYLLSHIQTKSDYIFFYPSEVLKMNKRFSLKKTNATVEDVLTEAFRDTSLVFKVLDRQIVVSKKDVSNIKLQNTLNVEQEIIKGKVLDKSGMPLPGVNVIIQGTSTGVVTNFDGEFELIAKTGDALVFSFVGMKTLTVTINKPFLNVVMEEDTEQLKTVVVTGYQNIDKKVFTGAAQTISAEEMKIDGVIDAGRMLEGRAAGVNVQNVTGTFGAAPKITIRGGSSIFGDTKPLWVIDGAVQEEIINLSFDQLVSGDSATLISSAIAGLNANDIESIEILKDASALSLYGARALNGAVIITTKRGKRETPSSITYQGEFSVRAIPQYSEYNTLNSQQTMSVYKEMYDKGFLRLASTTQGRYGGVYNLMYRAINTYNPETGSFLIPNTQEGRNTFLRQYEMANTDWFKTLFRATPTQNHTISLTGGGETSTQYASVGYFTDPGWTIADRIRRITGNLRNTYYLSDKVKAGILLQGSVREQNAPGTYNRQTSSLYGEYTREFDINPFSYALNTSRALRPYDNNGNLEYYRYNWAPFNIINELANNTTNLTVLDIKLQGDLGIDITDDLEYTFLGSVRYVNSSQEHNITENSNVAAAYRANETTVVAENNIFLFNDPDDPASLPKVVLPEGGILNEKNNELRSFYFRNAFDFSKNFNRNTLKLYLGQEYRHTDREESFYTGFGYQYTRGGIPFTDYRALQMSLGNNIDYFGKTNDRERGVAFFAQGNYAFDSKYVISATGNYEGSNKLGKSSTARWLPTWNVSGKWNASNEDFLKGSKVISNLSLRAGYGLVAGLGSASNALAIFRNGITNRFNVDDRENVINIIDLENSELTWEKLYETNVGIDLGMFNNDVNLTVDLYHKKSFDLIDYVRTSGIGGEYIKLANNADMDTKGIEISLATKNISTPNFKWSSNFNFATFDQKITKLQNEPNVLNLVRDVGGNVVGYQRNSLFSFDFAKLNDQGVPTYFLERNESAQTDVDFQETENILDYLKYEGPIEPNLTGGFSNTFIYKNWSLSALITWQAGNKIRLTPAFKHQYSDLDVFPGEFVNRWALPGDENVTTVPVVPDTRLQENYGSDLRRAYNAYNYSTERVVDGDFVRMKNIALTYSLPKDVVNKLNINQFKLRFQVTNPFLIYSDSRLNGQDPEFFRSGGVAYPIQKLYTLTLNVGL